MKLDYELINEILTKFVESEQSTVDVDYFTDLYEKDSQQLAHHLIIMEEKRLITGASSHGKLGIDLEYSNGKDVYEFTSGMPWRITSEGYDFAAALNKPNVLRVIKEKFQKEGLSAVIEISKKIAIKQAAKLLDE
ncbi:MULTISPECIES: DUF2513 domain-containing protein [Vibrio harveyi group]|uniref:DUF2513 domain-containing protein n=1 Tax=Vibrio harveyi group TaxID=717610 RepID=UPI00061AA035|nr:MULTISPECIES: DUF2513 domain-containing protein [Vibrio harveyi group]EJL6404769.1 DUF2513 domain-containing protein [Vibrio parahaemolyticus]KKC88351.1 hypothetical protein WR36_09760 [Vibrio parahaemolyticus]MCS0124759.1 DUF2513 domain-containing protein [Vibrio alginolyticus]